MARLCCFPFSTSCCSLLMCTWSTPYVYSSPLHPLTFSFPFIDRLRFTKVLVKSQLRIDHTQSMDELCFLLLLSVPAVTLPTILFLPSSYISVFLIWCPTVSLFILALTVPYCSLWLRCEELYISGNCPSIVSPSNTQLTRKNYKQRLLPVDDSQPLPLLFILVYIFFTSGLKYSTSYSQPITAGLSEVSTKESHITHKLLCLLG